MRCTVVGEMPTFRARSRSDQCVAPWGTSSSVRITTSSTWASLMLRGTPGRGSSPSPSSRLAGTGPPLGHAGPAEAQPRGRPRCWGLRPRRLRRSRPQRQPLGGLPPLRPVLQRPPLSLRQHRWLQPVITHATSRPRTGRTEPRAPKPGPTETKTPHVVPRQLTTGTLSEHEPSHQQGRKTILARSEPVRTRACWAASVPRLKGKRT